MFTIFFALIAFASATDETACGAFLSILESGQPLYLTTIDEAFACIESMELSAENKTTIMGTLTKVLDGYVFKDILKSPPQPTEYPEYYESVDLDAEMKTIEETAYSNFYDFFNAIHKMVVKARDGHLGLTITGEGKTDFNVLPMFFYYLPFDMTFMEGKTFLKPNANAVQYGVQLPQQVEQYQQLPVKTINGKKPEAFVQEFAEQYIEMRSPHAKFADARTSISFGSLGSRPLDKTYLKGNIQVVYLNEGNTETPEITVTYNYAVAFVNIGAISQSAQRKLKQHLSGKAKTVLTMDDIFETEEMYLKKQALKKDTGRLFEEGDDIYCYVDEENQINTLVVTTFIPDDSVIALYQTVSVYCAAAFKDNGYNIQVILPRNGGGIIYLEQLVQKSLSLYDDVALIGDLRVSELSEHMIKKGNYGKGIKDPKTCEQREQEGELTEIGEWYTQPREVTYGTVKHKTSQISMMNYYTEESYLEFAVDNKKPTEIVVYTDSYCFSCCAIFTKGMKEHGSAIIVGFDGDPSMEGVSKFEIGQSPTSVETYSTYFPDDAFTSLGLSAQYSFFESYRYDYEHEETVPREFLIDEIDERTNIPFYEESNLATFTAKTIEIINKYKTKCNPKNKRLMKIDPACDAVAKQKDSHAIGGYLCGDDGEWSETCDIARCEFGYHFDYKNKKCIEAVCKAPVSSSGNEEPSGEDGKEESSGNSGNEEPSGNGGNEEPSENGGNGAESSGNGEEQPSGNGGNEEPSGDNGKDETSGNDGKDEPSGDDKDESSGNGGNQPSGGQDKTGGSSSIMVLFMMVSLFFIF